MKFWYEKVMEMIPGPWRKQVTRIIKKERGISRLPIH
jgi:hypothetical protein